MTWVSSQEYLVFPSRMGQGPKPLFLWVALKGKNTFGDPISKGVPELVLKAQLGADEAPRHKGAAGGGSGAASKLGARSQEDAGPPVLDRHGVEHCRTASVNTSLTPSCCRAEHSLDLLGHHLAQLLQAPLGCQVLLGAHQEDGHLGAVVAHL